MQGPSLRKGSCTTQRKCKHWQAIRKETDSAESTCAEIRALVSFFLWNCKGPTSICLGQEIVNGPYFSFNFAGDRLLFFRASNYQQDCFSLTHNTEDVRVSELHQHLDFFLEWCSDFPVEGQSMHWEKSCSWAMVPKNRGGNNKSGHAVTKSLLFYLIQECAYPTHDVLLFKATPYIYGWVQEQCLQQKQLASFVWIPSFASDTITSTHCTLLM